MPGSSGDFAGSFTRMKQNPTRSKSSSELEEMRRLFRTNRESLRSVDVVVLMSYRYPYASCCREFENSPELRRLRVHFAGAKSVMWSHVAVICSLLEYNCE